jgi:hypothetical protein
MKNRAEKAIKTERSLFAFFLYESVLLNLDLTLRRLFRTELLNESLADLSSLLLSDDICNVCNLLPSWYVCLERRK